MLVRCWSRGVEWLTFVDDVPVEAFTLVVGHLVGNVVLHDRDEGRVVKSAALDCVELGFVSSRRCWA